MGVCAAIVGIDHPRAGRPPGRARTGAPAFRQRQDVPEVAPIDADSLANKLQCQAWNDER